jgi:glucose-induced degradation protein 4
MQRWKEQYFVNVGVDCGLTIAGFYYVLVIN